MYRIEQDNNGSQTLWIVKKGNKILSHHQSKTEAQAAAQSYVDDDRWFAEGSKQMTPAQKKHEAWRMVCEIAEFRPLQWTQDETLERILALVDHAQMLIDQPRQAGASR